MKRPGRFGLIGLFVAGVLLLGFSGVAEVVRGVGDVARFDAATVRSVAASRTPDLTRAFSALTNLGATWCVLLVATVAAFALGIVTRSYVPALLLGLTITGTTISVAITKTLLERPRPPASLAEQVVGGYGFPSGHATHATAAYLMLAVLITTSTGRHRRLTRCVIWVAAISVVLAVGVSRVVLGVHSPTDVIGGWILGTALVVLVTSSWLLLRRSDRR